MPRVVLMVAEMRYCDSEVDVEERLHAFLEAVMPEEQWGIKLVRAAGRDLAPFDHDFLPDDRTIRSAEGELDRRPLKGWTP